MENSTISIYNCENWQALIINEHLHARGIHSTIKSNITSSLGPWDLNSGGIHPSEIQVPYSERVLAVELVKNYLSKIEEE